MGSVPSDGSRWWIGDLLSYAGKNTAIPTRLSLRRRATRNRPKNFAWVSRKCPKEIRRAELSWRSHKIVAALKREDQIEWLARAAEEVWSSDELAGSSGGRVRPGERGQRWRQTLSEPGACLPLPKLWPRRSGSGLQKGVVMMMAEVEHDRHERTYRRLAVRGLGRFEPGVQARRIRAGLRERVGRSGSDYLRDKRHSHPRPARDVREVRGEDLGAPDVSTVGLLEDFSMIGRKPRGQTRDALLRVRQACRRGSATRFLCRERRRPHDRSLIRAPLRSDRTNLTQKGLLRRGPNAGRIMAWGTPGTKAGGADRPSRE